MALELICAKILNEIGEGSIEDVGKEKKDRNPFPNIINSFDIPDLFTNGYWSRFKSEIFVLTAKICVKSEPTFDYKDYGKAVGYLLLWRIVCHKWKWETTSNKPLANKRQTKDSLIFTRTKQSSRFQKKCCSHTRRLKKTGHLK